MMKSILYLLSALTLSAIALPERAAADEIAWKDYQYQDVYIRATGAMLYVMRPQTGDVITVRRSAVPDSAWKISEDTAHRAALLASWNRAQEAKKDSAPGGAQAAHVAAEDVEPAIEAAPSPRPGALRASGVPLLRLKGVPLETALQASLRSRNLDYRIDGDIIYVGRPQQLREVPGERLETRQYTLNSGLLATLPKIVVQSGGMRQLQPQAGFGGASSGYPGASGVASGYGSAGPGGGGGFGQGRFGGYGGGGYGGGGYGGGGYGGGGYGGGGGLQPDVTALSNISDLFSNIDDRRVGEPRAVVGSGLFFSTTSRNKYE